MEINFEYRGLGNTARIFLIAVAALLLSAPVSVGQLEPDRKVVERYQHFVIHRLCSEDGGSDALERYRSGRA